ncbi:myosin regulatory light chain sqh-like [Tropilaelaps mercedesae]|uniref:Myosin regulatory light chain sqh-like n=1 Tax=Tropilaelaps mercedesae TaxID=418985 RepID=A0A1V9XXP9_9ACAR|nr:myosin regulatory light chain sqh-like [Tropilaelaps mercedesae]
MASCREAGDVVNRRKTKPQYADTSNIFKVFDMAHTMELKEAFNLIDQERDGHISREDLRIMFESLGKTPDDSLLDGMINDACGNRINFTMFLTLFAERLRQTDPADVIRDAFSLLDEANTGYVSQDRLRELLTTMGDRLNDEQVDDIFRSAPIDKSGNFDYIEFTRILKHGLEDDNEV